MNERTNEEGDIIIIIIIISKHAYFIHNYIFKLITHTRSVFNVVLAFLIYVCWQLSLLHI